MIILLVEAPLTFIGIGKNNINFICARHQKVPISYIYFMKTHLVYFVLAQFQPKSATIQPSFYTKCIHVTLLNTTQYKRLSHSDGLQEHHPAVIWLLSCILLHYRLFIFYFNFTPWSSSILFRKLFSNFFLVNLVPVMPFTIFFFVLVLQINQFKPYWKRTNMVLRS